MRKVLILVTMLTICGVAVIPDASAQSKNNRNHYRHDLINKKSAQNKNKEMAMPKISEAGDVVQDKNEQIQSDKANNHLKSIRHGRALTTRRLR